jgi:hypothetical protein
MSVVTHQVLQIDRGQRLPPEVRRSLIDMGNACNGAAAHLHQALSHSMLIDSVMEAQRTEHSTGTLAQQVGDDLQRLADQHFEQAIVVLARASTIYAVYASRVAAAVATDKTPPTPAPEPIRPSDVITAYEQHLPEVRFAGNQDSHVAQEQNVAVAVARKALTDLITHSLHGETASAYDDVGAVTTDVGDDHRLVEFAAALHDYASVLVWALSGLSGARHDDIDS